MAWEYRGKHGPYYYRSRRVGGRVVKEYLGRGEAAHWAAMMDLWDKQQRQQQTDRHRQRKAEEKALEDQLDNVCHLARLATWTQLLLSGYHNHKGEWRKRRNA
ncbi:MAG TPA: hypothetical protein EYP56_07215 [Planctomycetaceae bacterium]|nr:hypothetical protein [Planctomycetaceae bacterium]